MSLEHFCQSRLLKRQQQHRLRQRSVLASSQGVHVRLDGRDFVNFSSNDYLGLAAHPDVTQAFKEAAAQYGVGSGASHLVNGHSVLHEQLEQALAEFTGRDKALLFSTGYMANLGVISALVGRGDAVFEDRLNHASLLDGGLLSAARFSRYRHNDVGHLAEQLSSSSARNRLVVTDGVFSMDGDLAPLKELSLLARQHDAWLLVDDAHGIGVLGENGAGCCEYLCLGQDDVPVLVGTLGKAFGSFGAFVAGRESLIDMLLQYTRPYIYTTALPPAVAAASLAALDILRQPEGPRLQLKTNIACFKNRAQALGLDFLPSDSAIQPIVLGDEQRVIQVAGALRDAGLLVGMIRPPTVPEGTSRLRVTLSAQHTEADIDHLLTSLGRTLTQVAHA
ncbi:MAG: 8-amino-7-oxononanoate synthase [Pseudomonadales bacterium]|nr:8-amino-7-oxononanoate synthase [Pseudomonadales bacterium]